MTLLNANKIVRTQDNKSHNAPPNKVIIDVAQPLMVKKYHDVAGAIDGHNSIRTNVLALDKIATDDWSKRVNLATPRNPRYDYGRRRAILQPHSE